MNRLSTENLLVLLTSQVEIELLGDYIMYKSDTGTFGLLSMLILRIYTGIVDLRTRRQGSHFSCLEGIAHAVDRYSFEVTEGT